MNIKPINFKLRSYQETILEQLKDKKGIGLFMGTGSGKTLTSLMRVKSNPTEKLLIICPQSVVYQWSSVMRKHFGGFSIFSHAKTATTAMIDKLIGAKSNDYNTFIFNFEKIAKLPSLLKIVDKSWTIIVDESHRIKSYGSPKKPVKVTHSVLKLGEKTPHKILLTATPTQGQFGGYLDYYPQLKFIEAINMTYKEYYNKYVEEVKINYGNSPYPVSKIVGYKYKGEIDEKLALHCKRYIPKFHEQDPEHIKVDIPKAPSYDKIQREFAYKDIMITNVSRKRIALKTIATGNISGLDMYDNHYHYEDNTEKLDWLSDFLQDTDEVVAIFYQYNVELNALERLMQKLGKKYIVINGNTKDKFAEIQRQDYDVVLGQFQAMSESLDGLHLRCHIEIFFAMPESSLIYRQALGRIDRDGQTRLPIYYYLIMENTIEDDIYKMIEKKIEFSERTLNTLLITEAENEDD
jgi:superfamily II DNA or RNA helicase